MCILLGLLHKVVHQLLLLIVKDQVREEAAVLGLLDYFAIEIDKICVNLLFLVVHNRPVHRVRDLVQVEPLNGERKTRVRVELSDRGDVFSDLVLYHLSNFVHVLEQSNDEIGPDVKRVVANLHEGVIVFNIRKHQLQKRRQQHLLIDLLLRGEHCAADAGDVVGQIEAELDLIVLNEVEVGDLAQRVVREAPY